MKKNDKKPLSLEDLIKQQIRATEENMKAAEKNLRDAERINEECKKLQSFEERYEELVQKSKEKLANRKPNNNLCAGCAFSHECTRRNNHTSYCASFGYFPPQVDYSRVVPGLVIPCEHNQFVRFLNNFCIRHRN